MTLTFSRKKKTIEVDGQEVHLLEASEAEIQGYSDHFLDSKGNPIKKRLREARIRMMQLCVVDENGKKMFDETHATELMEWPSSVTRKIYEEARELCGLSDDGSGDEEKN